jgi:hypothetical protein
MSDGLVAFSSDFVLLRDFLLTSVAWGSISSYFALPLRRRPGTEFQL